MKKVVATKKKILFVINSLECGGAEKSLVSLLPLLDPGRYDIDIMVFKKGGEFEIFLPGNCRILTPGGYLDRDLALGAMLRQGRLGDLWIRLSAALRLKLKTWRGSRRAHEAEILWPIVTSAVPRAVGRYDTAVAFGQGAPTYYVADKVDAPNKVAWINIDTVKARYSKRFNTPYYDRYQTIVPVSDGLAVILEREYRFEQQRLRTIYDIINPDFIREMSRQGGGLPPGNGCRILTIGRLVEQKGYDIALAAAAILKGRGIDFHWYVIGEGALRGELERGIAASELTECFTLLGVQVNPYGQLKECDIYAQTSRFEGFCLTLAEARIFQKPLVSTNFTVVTNQIRHGENGLIAEMNGASVADALERLIRDAGLRDRLIEATGRDRIDNVETELPKIEALLSA